MKTLHDKIWDSHVVHADSGQPPIIYIDLHLIHEVTTPQAFDGLRIAGRKVRRPDLTIGTLDHGIPTLNRNLPFENEVAAKQVETMRKNCRENNIRLFDLDQIEQGIVHVFAPEQGFVKPGMTIACGDSHTGTLGAFGALSFGIGTSDVELVLATQCLRLEKSGNFRVQIDGELPFGVTAKDIILGVINSVGTDGATGHVIEYCGTTIENLSMEGRMTICNMSIEAGARSGLIAPDETTFKYLRETPNAPLGEDWDKAVDEWRNLFSDDGALFDKTAQFDAADFEPFVTWGTSPGMSVKVTGCVPSPDTAADEAERASFERAMEYMALEPGQKITEIPIDRVFIGSCTNARIEDLRAAANVVKGYKIAKNVRGLVVPGSMLVKKQAEEEGIAQVLLDAGFEWRDAGCSMCLGMNNDVLKPGERCASTSNRNFEGRQGRGGRTHLVSPSMAAAAAVAGHFVDIRDWKFKN